MSVGSEQEQKSKGLGSVVQALPLGQVKEDFTDMAKAMAGKGLESASKRVANATNSLNSAAENGGVLNKATFEGGKAALQGKSPVGGAVKGGFGGLVEKAKKLLPGGKGGGGKGPLKSTNIVESIDIGAPLDVVYDQWTQFEDFSHFMKKVEGVNQEEDTKLGWKAQIFWSHRTWKATILDQVRNDHIVWRSEGAKGHVDGAITFHELAPNLTRVLVVLEYYPQGLFERTGNIWRAQGRRARLELKHFRRHVMTRVILDPEQLEGWHGEIHESEVTLSHEDAVEEERAQEESGEGEEPEEGGPEEGEPEDEYEEGEEAEEGEPEDEYEEGEEAEEGEPEDEYEGEEPEQPAEQPEDEYEGEEPEEPEEAAEQPEDEYEEGEEPAESEEAGEQPADELEGEEPAEEEPAEEEPADESAEEEPEEEPEPAPSRSRSRGRARKR